MKKAIVISVVAVAIMVLFTLFSVINTGDYSTGSFTRVFIQLLILVGLVKGHRLAWQWGRVLTLLSFIGMLIATIMLVAKGSNVLQITPFIFYGIPALVIFISFGTQSAKEHFNLLCPACSSSKIKANDFLFNEAKCKKCNHIW